MKPTNYMAMKLHLASHCMCSRAAVSTWADKQCFSEATAPAAQDKHNTRTKLNHTLKSFLTKIGSTVSSTAAIFQLV